MAVADPQAYISIQTLHKALPAFAPYLSDALLPYLAFFLLAATFTLAFYFSTLPKSAMALREVAVATIASILGGFGVVALFCSVGVRVRTRNKQTCTCRKGDQVVLATLII